MRFRMLGPLEVWSDNGWVGISAGKWRSLLACLLLKSGQIVPTETLIQELWGDVPPSTANNLVSIYVHRLRRLIGDSEGRVIVHRKPGYQLRLSDGDTDLSRFEALTADARAALTSGDTEAAARLLSEAEGLWRGSFLADVPTSVLVATESERTMELRLAATELRIGVDLTRGRHAEVVPELRFLVAGHPLREGLWLQLMRALSQAGRHAEALEVYGHAREVISGELGVDPGPELRQLYAELLAADAAPRVPSPREPSARPSRAHEGPRAARGAQGAVGLAGDAGRERGGRDADGTAGEAQGTIALGEVADGDGHTGDSGGAGGTATAEAPAEADGPAEPPWAPLAQLPADIADFTGRTEEVRLLCDMMTRPDAASGPGAVRIAVVAGAAGLGKTTLAVHAAHQVRGLFPDGQLYVDLSGASAQPASSAEVLARFLRDLGVDGDKIPASEDERGALFRTRLTGRRVLVVLDNARDAAQVRPLLPGSASCAVLVTTRSRIPALVSTRFVDLNTLSDLEALELFTRVVDDGRPAAEPDATAEVLLACAGLPLAIRICAARLAARRQWKVATLAIRLRDSRRRLDEMQAGDLEVRSSFQVSYDALRAGRHRVDPARVFRLLGLWQGRTISLPAATALIGAGEGDVAAVLERLVDANLLESPAPDWYQFHDLLRVYAAERAEEEEPREECDEAVARLLHWYLGMAAAAADLVAPFRYRDPVVESIPDSSPTSLAEALNWYESERGNVLAATRQAASAGLCDVAWRLPTALFPLFNRRDSWADCTTAHRVAVRNAREAEHRLGEAWALQNLGAALSRVGEKESLEYLEGALAIRREISDRSGEAQTAISLADAYHKLEGAEIAFEHSLRCLKVLREVGNTSFLGTGLNNHGEFCLELGRLDEAADCFRESLEIWQGLGVAYGQGHALHNLGRVYMQSGRIADAIASLRESHRLHKTSGDLKGQAIALMYLGYAQRDIGREDDARKSLTAALGIFEKLESDGEIEAIHAALAA